MHRDEPTSRFGPDISPLTGPAPAASERDAAPAAASEAAGWSAQDWDSGLVDAVLRHQPDRPARKWWFRRR
jgi:hypothetical protein